MFTFSNVTHPTVFGSQLRALSPRRTAHMARNKSMDDYHCAGNKRRRIRHSALSVDEPVLSEHRVDLLTTPLDQLMSLAASIRNQSHPSIVTFSPKIFIPVTRLCRNSCGYCTFALPPLSGKRCYMTIDEMVEVATLGAKQGCTEALFTLGDKPELLYPEAAAELASLGYASTLHYVEAAARIVLERTGLLPHINAGVMSSNEMRALKKVSVSQGLMLEGTAESLHAPGGAHHGCPDKDPDVRLGTLEAAGKEGIPYTTGVLIGIGESRVERIEALQAIKQLSDRHGHIQELIIQPFKAKLNTGMEKSPEPSFEELLWTVAVARILFRSKMNIQAPPNLLEKGTLDADAEENMSALLQAGINDWGGLSPITRDYVNPERAWPHVEQLARVTARAGKILVPRLPVYPEFISTIGEHKVKSAVLKLIDGERYVSGSSWFAGMAAAEGSTETDNSSVAVSTRDDGGALGQRSTPQPRARATKVWRVSIGMDGTLNNCHPHEGAEDVARVLTAMHSAAYEPTVEDVARLFSARGVDFSHVCTAADVLRQHVNGDVVTYVVNRNINYTNICSYACKFCAISKGKAAEDLRGSPYLLSLDDITQRTSEAWKRGATEVCMQGGIHPDFTGDTYLDIIKAAKDGAPDIHIHAFSPLEIHHGASTLGLSLPEYLSKLKKHGLGSLPGTAAEVLDDGVRAELCPDKLNTAEWCEVISAAHMSGLKTTSTIMFGHCDTYESWATHLLMLRKLAMERPGYITEFVPLPFVHMEAPIYRSGHSRRGPTLREAVLMHAIGRLVLHPHITNIQASWVKMGPEMAGSVLLHAGCNDMGGVLMNESITKAAGAQHGQQVSPSTMEDLIQRAQKIPKQRSTLYGVTQL